jgi:hypothetical protein
MAKAAKKADKVNIKLLQAMAASTDTFYISKDDGLPLLTNDPALIEVNTAMTDANGNAAARLTEAGAKLVAGDKPAPTNEAAGEAPKPSPYAIIKNATLPPSKRGNKGGGAPTQYPFADLEVGASFFVPVSEKHPEPVKTLGSTVSSANMRYAVKTGETKEVSRAKRGDDKKAVMGTDGKKIMEKVQVPVYKYDRKFSIRGVEKGKSYGEWVAPADGALIARVS